MPERGSANEDIHLKNHRNLQFGIGPKTCSNQGQAYYLIHSAKIKKKLSKSSQAMYFP